MSKKVQSLDDQPINLAHYIQNQPDNPPPEIPFPIDPFGCPPPHGMDAPMAKSIKQAQVGLSASVHGLTK